MGLLDGIARKIRRYGRRVFRPMTIDEASEKKEIFAVSYFITAFLFFCYMNYSILMQEDPLNKLSLEERAKHRMERFRIDEEKVRVYKFKNFTKVEDFVISQEEELSAKDEK